MEAVQNLARVLGFLDVVAEGEGRGGDYVTEELKREASERAGLVLPYIEAAAAAVLAAWLARKLDGVPLDKDEPFSDASLSAVLSDLLGVPVESVRDKEKLKEAIRKAITARLSQELGYPFEDVFDKALLRRDVLRFLGQRSGELVPGLHLTDLSSLEVTRRDVLDFGRLHVSSLTGINFQDLNSKQQIKEDIYAYVMPIIEQQILDEENGEGEYKKPLKMDTRSIKNREAVRRFRAAHGARVHYEPV